MTHINGHAVRWYSFKKRAERKRELEASLREVKNQMAAEQEPLRDELAESGLRSAKLEDGSTIYIHRSVFVGAKDTDYDRACDAVADAGMGEFVQRRFNSNTISAWYREQTANGDTIPSDLEDTLDVAEKINLRVRST